jgi:glycosyltransferase involved in cell wall biosynthesis
MTKKASILVANYNNGRYMMDAINSVRRQSYPDWEIIIVDDCSTDNSFDIYKDLEGDDRIHIFYNSNNMGCGYTKHQCVIHANGDICGFLDPDDALTEDAIQIMVAEHEKHPDASLINSTCFETDERLDVISISTYGCFIPQGQSFLTYRKGIAHFATFKKKCYEKTEGIDLLMLRAVDHDLYYKLEEVGNVYYIDKPLYYYRQNTANNISLGEGNMLKAHAWDIYSMVNACKRRGISIEDNALKYIDEFVKSGINKGEMKVRNSKSFILGHKLLHPISSFRKYFDKHDGGRA